MPKIYPKLWKWISTLLRCIVWTLYKLLAIIHVFYIFTQKQYWRTIWVQCFLLLLTGRSILVADTSLIARPKLKQIYGGHASRTSTFQIHFLKPELMLRNIEIAAKIIATVFLLKEIRSSLILLTRPPSTMFVTMTITQTPWSHTVRQKSPNVLATGPEIHYNMWTLMLWLLYSKN